MLYHFRVVSSRAKALYVWLSVLYLVVCVNVKLWRRCSPFEQEFAADRESQAFRRVLGVEEVECGIMMLR